MKKNRYVVLVVFCFAALLNFSASAQNYIQDMQKIRDGYKNSMRSFNMKYIYYPYDSLNKAADSMRGTCTILGNSYYYNVSSGKNIFEYLKNEQYYLVIDHPNKAVAVNFSSNAKQDLWSVEGVDSLLQKPGIKLIYKSLGKNKGQYEVSYAQGAPWNKLRLVFDKTRYTLSEVWLYSSTKGKILGEPYNKPRIAIFYYPYKGNMPDKSIFSEKKFMNHVGNEIMLTGEYKKYRLLNYMNQPKKS